MTKVDLERANGRRGRRRPFHLAFPPAFPSTLQEVGNSTQVVSQVAKRPSRT